MNEIDAWLACDEDERQFVYTRKPRKECAAFVPDDGDWFQVFGHDINPGDCRPVRLRVEVVKDGE